ncbi:hypothetical protein CW362_07570 [Streptomyces populi]|uniref:Uncharacterized protein n=1 Tax=Streptomyces populi TaxID=2058924 RepID=A0A2I0SUP1_9ACTN|nr:hypothetical protein CW362_07570 [Streptomyces populi]
MGSRRPGRAGSRRLGHGLPPPRPRAPAPLDRRPRRGASPPDRVPPGRRPRCERPRPRRTMSPM